MKKNFFKKKLASALALALVVASVSPVSASAATVAKIVDKSKSTATTVLYVDKVSYGKSAVDYSLSKTYAGTKYTWTISDAKKATINAKTGHVVAKAPGVVTVKVTAKNTKGKTTTFSQKVTVRKRATAVAVGEDFTLNAGETKALKATLTPSNSTDAVRYYSSNDKVATVDAVTGVVTAVGAGEATITVYAKAASTAPNTSQWNVSATVKAKVNLGLAKAEQTKAAELKLTFNGDPKDVKASDLSIVKDETKQVVAVKSVEAKDSVLTVATFADMTDGKAYTVTYGGKSVQFTATDNVVASLTITPVTVPYETLTDVSVSKVDAKGVVLGSYKLGEVTDSKLDFSISTTQGYTSATKLLLFKIGDTAKATATYHTYKYDTTGNEVGAIKAEVTITAVDKTAISVTDTKYTISKDTPNWDKLTANTTLAIKDQNYKLFFYAKDSNNTVVKAPQSGTDYRFESSNKDILLVNGNTDLTAGLVAVSQGSAYVLVKNADGKVLWSLPVTIVAERKAASLTASTNAFTLSSSVDAEDEQAVKLTVKDQYSADMDAPLTANIAVTCLNAPSGVNKDNVTGSPYFQKADGKVTFYGKGVTTAGTYVYKITVGDYSQVVNVTVKDPDSKETAVYRLVFNTNSVDVNFDGSSSDNKYVTVKVGGFKSGVVASYGSIAAADVVIKKGSDVVKTGYTVTSTTTGSTITFDALTVDGFKNVTKAAAGSYSVEVKYATVVLTGGFVITDTQAGLTAVRQDTITKSTGLSLEAGILETFKFYYDGKELTGLQTTDITGVTKVQNGKDYSIVDITVAVPINGGYHVPVTVKVGQTITLK